jgi:hypothetical protein
MESWVLGGYHTFISSFWLSNSLGFSSTAASDIVNQGLLQQLVLLDSQAVLASWRVLQCRRVAAGTKFLYCLDDLDEYKSNNDSAAATTSYL